MPPPVAPPEAPEHSAPWGAIMVAAAALVLLPATVIAGLTWAFLHAFRGRIPWWFAWVGAAVAALVDLLVLHGLGLTPYGLAFHQVVGSFSAHSHARLDWLALAPLVIPLAVPLGLLAGGAAAWRSTRNAPRKGPAPGVGRNRWGVRSGGRDAASAPLRGAPPRRGALAALRSARDVPAPRVPVGLLEGRAAGSLAESHVAVVAPTGSGKTRGVILPALLSWRGPCVATSTKSDILWDEGHGSGALAWRQSLGSVWIFDPTGSNGDWGDTSWTPLRRCRTWQGARATARAVLSASGRGGASESGTSSFFLARSEQVLAPLLHAAALADLPLSRVFAWVRRSNFDEALEILGEGESVDLGALGAAQGLRVGSDTSTADVASTVLSLLGPLEGSSAVLSLRPSESWDPGELLEGMNSLFLLSRAGSPDAGLHAALLDELLATVEERAGGGSLDPPLLLALDEVANVAPVPDLPARLATVRSQGVRILTAWQSVSQIESRYGQGSDAIVLGNSGTQVWWPTTDPSTLRHLSAALGRVTIETVSESTDVNGRLTGHSRSRTEVDRLDAAAWQASGRPLLIAGGTATLVDPRHHDEDGIGPKPLRRGPLSGPLRRRGRGKPAQLDPELADDVPRLELDPLPDAEEPPELDPMLDEDPTGGERAAS
ncbi:MAG: type IV secretory system conjugative DNA transfer family protein [Actinomycetota bacterium]|nr:type IV secretory system conjugative DNA transfer family protein [Actinomycetota bacterium]